MGTGSTIKWNPNNTTGGQDAKGSQERPAFVGLGHEIGHSFEYATGTTDYITTQSDGSLPQERKSLDVENAVRRQHNLTPRRQYGPNRFNVPSKVPNGWIPHKKNRAGD